MKEFYLKTRGKNLTGHLAKLWFRSKYKKIEEILKLSVK